MFSSFALDAFVASACIVTISHKLLADFICEMWSFPRREAGSVCSQTHHFPWHAMFWLMAPHYQRSRDATLDVYKLLSLEVDGARTEARPSVRRQLISCPAPATVAGFSQESSSEFWETHQRANSCDSTWTWWKLFLSPLSLFLSSSRVTLSDCRGPGSPAICIHIISGFNWYKKARILRRHCRPFSLCRLSVDVYEHVCRVGCVRSGGVAACVHFCF